MSFQLWRNDMSDEADRTSAGRLLQSRGRAVANDRSPTVTHRDGRTSRRLVFDERRRARGLVERSAAYCSWSSKYTEVSVTINDSCVSCVLNCMCVCQTCLGWLWARLSHVASSHFNQQPSWPLPLSHQLMIVVKNTQTLRQSTAS